MKKMIAKVSSSLTLATIVATQTVQTVFAQDRVNVLSGGSNSRSITKPTGFADSVGDVINAVLTFVMTIAALLVLLYLIWGGIEWITSGGDKGKTEGARNKITAAVIGLIILAAAYAIFRLSLTFLGFNGVEDVFNVTTIS